MAVRPSLPEIITVNSESLQTAVRDLLPSQNGFGSELQATNVITPIIDLTPTAEGTQVPEYQQQAQAFGSQTAFQVGNTTTTLANSVGFWRIQGSVFLNNNGLTTIDMTDGLSSKQIYRYAAAPIAQYENIPIDFIIFLASGESISITANAASITSGSYRQLATGDGSAVNPSGFPI